jgi:DNA topoisomerase-1
MDKVLAAVVLLLERTLIRIGNEEYARTNGSYGLTTLRDDHVEVTATEVRFSFRGKSGKAHDVEFRDRRLARIVRGCRDLPGQTLFQYRGADGVPHALGSSEVNAYVREVTGEAFTAKDFRTWHGSVLAAVTLLELETSEHTGASVVPEAIRRVASQLGNTPAVCRNCYVHPAVLDAHAEGRLRPLADQTALDEGGGYAHGERLLLALLAS